MAYVIGKGCSGCGMCVEACPLSCISDETVPVQIDPERCVDCGVCEGECPLGVVSPPPAAAA